MQKGRLPPVVWGQPLFCLLLLVDYSAGEKITMRFQLLVE